jgi:hypothetical protein
MMKTCLLWMIVLAFNLLPAVLPANEEDPAALESGQAQVADQPNLSNAVICETLDAFKPLNTGAVFAVRMGSVMCFTAFDYVPEETSIFHDWIRRDKLVFRKKLILKTPRWSSVSSIQLREADKGPWRVDVRDADGRLLHTLRFSITD